MNKIIPNKNKRFSPSGFNRHFIGEIPIRTNRQKDRQEKNKREAITNKSFFFLEVKFVLRVLARSLGEIKCEN